MSWKPIKGNRKLVPRLSSSSTAAAMYTCTDYISYLLFLYFLLVFFSVWFNSDVRLDFVTIPKLVSVNLMLSVDFGRPITFLFGSNI